MSKQSPHGPLHKLHKALEYRSCRWKVLTVGERTRLIDQFNNMVKNSEAKEKVGKKTGKKVEKAAKRPSTHATQHKAKCMAASEDKEESESDNKVDTNDDEVNVAHRKAIADMSVQEKRQHLLRLAGQRVAKSSKRAGGAGGGTASQEGQGEGCRWRGLEGQEGQGGHDKAVGKGEGSKQKRVVEEDEGSRKKRKKESSEETLASRMQHACSHETKAQVALRQVLDSAPPPAPLVHTSPPQCSFRQTFTSLTTMTPTPRSALCACHGI
jgi:hypothetical protein